MKALVTAILVFLTFCCYGNVIDKLKTLDDVNAFLESKTKNKKPSFFGELKNDTTTKLSRTRFIKIDLNNDGLTDLIVNGKYLFVVIDMGKNDFKFSFIDDGDFKQYTLSEIDTIKNQPRIIVKSYFENEKYEKKKIEHAFDTLIVKYSGVIEYNAHPENATVSKISFSTTECFGTCPVFELTLQSDGTAKYHAIKYNDEKGNFTSKIDTGSLNKLSSLISYTGLRKLNDYYSVSWSDLQTCELKVTYEDGYTKKIRDYGMIGTFGLQRLYNALFELRASQEWQGE